MRIKRKAVSNELASGMPMDDTGPVASLAELINGDSATTSISGLAGLIPVSDSVNAIHSATSSAGASNGNLQVPHLNVVVPAARQSSVSVLQSPLQGCEQSAATSIVGLSFHDLQHVMPGAFVPVQVTTIDGSVCTFTPSNNVTRSFLDAQEAAPFEGWLFMIMVLDYLMSIFL